MNDSNKPMESISKFFVDLRRLQGFMRFEHDHRDLWKDTIFPGLHISPILGDLLSAHFEQADETDIANVMFPAFRFAAILYVSGLRSKFGIDSLSAIPIYAGKLRNSLEIISSREIQPNLLLWILCVGYTSPCLPEQNEWFQSRIQEILFNLDITNLANLKDLLYQFVWDEELISPQSQLLEGIFNV
jgi:hypothetical protein